MKPSTISMSDSQMNYRSFPSLQSIYSLPSPFSLNCWLECAQMCVNLANSYFILSIWSRFCPPTYCTSGIFCSGVLFRLTTALWKRLYLFYQSSLSFSERKIWLAAAKSCKQLNPTIAVSILFHSLWENRYGMHHKPSDSIPTGSSV